MYVPCIETFSWRHIKWSAEGDTSVSNTDSRNTDRLNSALTSVGGWVVVMWSWTSSRCLSAFHKACSDYSYRFQIASFWTTRNPVMSFIKLQCLIWMLYESYVSHYLAVHPSPFLALKMVCLVSWSHIKSKSMRLLCVTVTHHLNRASGTYLMIHSFNCII